VASIAGALAGTVLLLAGCGSSGPASQTPSPLPTATASPISRDATAGRKPVLVLDPTHGALGVTVRVTGSGYGPNVMLTGTICAVDAQGNVQNPLAQCDVTNIVSVTTDGHGGFATTYTVKRLPAARSGYTIGFGMSGDSGESAGSAFAIDA
jgi:hypothetical protein